MFVLTVIKEIKTFIIFFVNHFPFFICFLLIKTDKYVIYCQLFNHFESTVFITLISDILFLLSFNYNMTDDNRLAAHFMINVTTVLNICADMIDRGYTVKSFNAPAF